MTTAEAAHFLSVKPGNLPRMAATHGVTPAGRVRSGRSTYTMWSLHDIARLARIARERAARRVA